MKISATVTSRQGRHQTVVRTADKEQDLAIPAKPDGAGSGVNGGELLFLALATCYCNDLYREAKVFGFEIEAVEVEVSGQFGGKGEPATDIRYRTAVKANGSEQELLALMRHTDTVAEIHNTLRRSTPVLLAECSVLEPDRKNGDG
jgi:organic hydroperoxide reductase OsmC/OhrA